MDENSLDFSVGDGAASGDYSPLPPDNYLVMLEDWKLVPTKNERGKIIKVTFHVLEGEFKDRKIFDQWNYINDNQQAQDIGRGKLTSLSEALGWAPGQVLKSLDPLKDKPVVAVVKIKAGQGDYGASNQIQSFKGKAAAAKTGARPVAGGRPKSSAPVPNRVPQAATAAHDESEDNAPWEP